MRNIDQFNVTQAVLQRIEGCPNPRLKQVLSAVVQHLHDLAREVQLTEEELMQGIQFLTDTGHMCDDKRQEFILLSDTLGLSMLTVAQNNSKPPRATESTVFGPFHVQGAPEFPEGADISNGAKGEPLFVTATVRGLDGRPVAGATVDTWQADDDGVYDVQVPDGPLRARAVRHTDAQGRLSFRSVLPVAYPVPTDGPVGKMLEATGRHPWRPAHVHFRVQAPGYQTLITHVFRDGDAYLDSDVVFGVRSSLIGDFRTQTAGQPPFGPSMEHPFHTLHFDFVLNPA